MPRVDQPDEPAYRCHLPIPPSANNNYPTAGRRRVKSAAYKAWIDAAGWGVKRQNAAIGLAPPFIRSRVLIEVPLSRRRDIDNAIKPILDLMVTMGVLKGDNWIDDLHIVRRGEGDMVTVSIWPMS